MFETGEVGRGDGSGEKDKIQQQSRGDNGRRKRELWRLRNVGWKKGERVAQRGICLILVF